MELQSAGRLDGAACSVGFLVLHGSLLTSHWVSSSQGDLSAFATWLDGRPAAETSCLLRTPLQQKASNDMKQVLYALEPRTYCFVLCNTTNPNLT